MLDKYRKYVSVLQILKGDNKSAEVTLVENHCRDGIDAALLSYIGFIIDRFM